MAKEIAKTLKFQGLFQTILDGSMVTTHQIATTTDPLQSLESSTYVS